MLMYFRCLMLRTPQPPTRPTKRLKPNASPTAPAFGDLLHVVAPAARQFNGRLASFDPSVHGQQALESKIFLGVKGERGKGSVGGWMILWFLFCLKGLLCWTILPFLGNKYNICHATNVQQSINMENIANSTADVPSQTCNILPVHRYGRRGRSRSVSAPVR